MDFKCHNRERSWKSKICDYLIFLDWDEVVGLDLVYILHVFFNLPRTFWNKISNQLEFGVSKRVTMIPMTITMILMVAIYLSSEEFISRTCRVLGTGVLAVCSPGGLPWLLWFSWLIGCHWSLVLAVCSPGVFHDFFMIVMPLIWLIVLPWRSLVGYLWWLLCWLYRCNCIYVHMLM